jgi:hypothetical protein
MADGLDFKLRTFGDHAMEFSLRRMGDRAGTPPGLRPILEKIGDRMLDDEQRLFDSSGRTAGRPWRPLEKSTRLRKERARYPFPSKPNIATTHEMISLTRKNSPDNIFRVTDIYVIIGSSAPAVGFQQTGTISMPARPPLMFSRLQQDYYYKLMTDFVFEGRLPAHA